MTTLINFLYACGFVLLVLFLGGAAGYADAVTSVFKGCHEQGTATLYPGVVISCKVEITK